MFGAHGGQISQVKCHQPNLEHEKLFSPVGTPLVSVPKRLPFGYKKLEGTLIPKDEMAKG